jgi:hypothetical protein
MSQAQIVDDGGVLHTSNAQLLGISHPAEEGASVGAQPPVTQELQLSTNGQQQQQQNPNNVTQPEQQLQLTPEQMAQMMQQQPQQIDFSKLDDNGKAWWNQFQQYTGFSPEQVMSLPQQIQQLQSFVHAQQREQQAQTLRAEWGNDFDTVMPQIAERFRSLPPQMQAALDNIDGARLLYSQIMSERQARVPGAQPPRFDRPTTPAPSRSQEPQFTKDQIRNMSDADYQKNQQQIMYAYANGLVR